MADCSNTAVLVAQEAPLRDLLHQLAGLLVACRSQDEFAVLRCLCSIGFCSIGMLKSSQCCLSKAGRESSIVVR